MQTFLLKWACDCNMPNAPMSFIPSLIWGVQLSHKIWTLYLVDLHDLKNSLDTTQVGWPSGWSLGLKVFVPGLTGFVPQIEFEYLHCEKNPWVSNLPHQGSPVVNSDQFLVESFEHIPWETKKKKNSLDTTKNQRYIITDP